jgi:DNA-binding NarL/FixJ family response regulator
MSELKLLIADDHRLIRRGLRDLLSGQRGWQVVGEACDGAEAVEMALQLRPDVVILDFFMPRLTGPQAAARIVEKMPGIGIVVLTMDDSERVIRDVLQAGARALVLKSDADRDLLVAIDLVAKHGHFFASRVAKTIAERYLSGRRDAVTKANSPAVTLTEREREVMRLLAAGMKNREVATHLRISIRTVETHRVNMSRKLNLGSIVDLVRYAICNGIAIQA